MWRSSFPEGLASSAASAGSTTSTPRSRRQRGLPARTRSSSTPRCFGRCCVHLAFLSKLAAEMEGSVSVAAAVVVGSRSQYRWSLCFAEVDKSPLNENKSMASTKTNRSTCNFCLFFPRTTHKRALRVVLIRPAADTTSHIREYFVWVWRHDCSRSYTSYRFRNAPRFSVPQLMGYAG